MRIGQLARSVGVATSAIRYYEQIGLLDEPRRTESGYRNYDETAGNRLRFIKIAQNAGLTLTETRSIFELRDTGEAPCDHVARLIHKKRAEIGDRIKALQVAQRELATLAARADSLSPANCRPEAICHIIEGEPTDTRRPSPGT